MLRRRFRPDPAHREQGSIIVAVVIIMIVVALASILAAQALGNEQIVVNRQNNFAGISVANAGVSDALFRLDQGTAGTGGGTSFCVKPNDAACAAGSIPGAPGVSYLASKNSSTKWTIQALGTVNGVNGAVQETVTRTQLYPYALFGNSGLNFNGQASGAFATYSPDHPDSSSNPDSSGPVAIGSNGTIVCNGGLGSNVTSVYYSGGGGVSGGCGTTQSISTLYNLPTPQAPNSPAPDPCPNGGQLGSGITGAPITLLSGTYLCTVPVTISGNLTVTTTNGPVNLYIILDPTVYGTGTAALTIIRNSTVNAAASYNPGDTLPDASQLRIYSNSTGTFGNDNGQGYSLGAIVYAPLASLTGDGCKSVYYGSLVINTLTCNGGPHLSVNYDTDLANMYGPWSVSGYLQISPGSVPSF